MTLEEIGASLTSPASECVRSREGHTPPEGAARPISSAPISVSKPRAQPYCLFPPLPSCRLSAGAQAPRRAVFILCAGGIFCPLSSKNLSSVSES